MESNVVNLWYFKLWILLNQLIWVWNIKGLQHRVLNIWFSSKELYPFTKFFILVECAWIVKPHIFPLFGFIYIYVYLYINPLFYNKSLFCRIILKIRHKNLRKIGICRLVWWLAGHRVWFYHLILLKGLERVDTWPFSHPLFWYRVL